LPLIKNGTEHRPRVNPKDRPDYTEAEIQALRAVQRGAATPDQQILLIEFLITVVSNTYDILWRADQRMTDLALGQALPGQHMVYMLNIAPTKTDENKISSRPEQK